MSDVQNYILTIQHDRQKAKAFAVNTAKDLELKQSTLMEVVKSLGEYINDDDPAIRFLAVEYLSEVISGLQSNFLSRQQTQVLCQFLCDRIEDGGAIAGLTQLQVNDMFNKEMAQMTFRALVAHFQDLQIRPQSQRLQILELLNTLMCRKRDAIREMGNESITGIIDLVGGEKDPRNLMIIFSILKAVMIEWNISSHAEILFDSVFCYFPITFRPPPDDPYGITAFDLKNRLKECIAADGLFAPYAFPQLIDKLDSKSPNVKRDVLQSISACASSYGVTAVAEYSITLWDSVKFEILNAQEGDLVEEALASLQAIATCLGHGLNSNDPRTPLADFLRPIVKECNEQLQTPTHKQAQPAGQILGALGHTSPIAFSCIVKGVLPPLDTLYQDAGSIAEQRALLEVITQILDAAIVVYGTLSVLDPLLASENPLRPFKDRLFELSSQALMSTTLEEVSFRIVAIKVLLRLSSIYKCLQDNEIRMFVQYLGEVVLGEDSNGRNDLRKEAVQALVNISNIKPNLIMETTFPAFMSKLPDSCISTDQTYLVTLEGLAQLSAEKFVADTLVRRLLSKLEVVLQNRGSHAYPQAILSTLHYVLSRQDLAQNPNLAGYHEKIVVGLIGRAVTASTGTTSITALSDESTLKILGRLATRIVQTLDKHKQNSVALQVYSLFTDEGSFQPIPFRGQASSLERSTMILSTALLAGVDSSSTLEFLDGSGSSRRDLLAELVRLALAEEIPSIRQTILQQVGLMSNKMISPEDMRYTMNVLGDLLRGLSTPACPLENPIRAIFWIAKALILRLYNTNEILDHLLLLLPIRTYSLHSARGFRLLLAPDEILCKENGATVRLLANQKVFNICVPTIAKQFQHADAAVKPNYLIALSGILKYMPTEVIMLEIGTLLPLLLQSLDLQDLDIKATTIQSIALVSQQSPEAVEGHISSLVGRLLKSANNPRINSTEVRYAALHCLRIFPGRMKDSNLLPYKNAVTRGLMAILDDPRRHVRKAAVECRATWFNMDEPQSD